MFGRKKTPLSSRIDTLIARSARLQGDIEFAGGLHLEGHVIGNVRAAAGESATLWISEQGIVEGAVDVPSLVVNGVVNGDVHARERVVIGATARIHGNVHYGTIEMALGAQVSGKLIPMVAKSQATGSGATDVVDEPSGQRPDAPHSAAELPPAAVDALFDARRCGT
jgi:cytoskeletal protein CcmA (bactofilin family)